MEKLYYTAKEVAEMGNVCSLCCVTEAMIYFFSGYKYVVLAQYWIVDKRG